MATIFRDVVVNRSFTLPRPPTGTQEPNNLLLTTLATLAIGQPIVDYDYPNPRAAARLQVVDYPVNLLITTLAPVATGNPFHTFDWTNPQLVRRTPVVDFPQTFIGTLLPATQTIPFNVDDWPVPIGVRRGSVANLSHIFYYIQDPNGPPNYQYDFPNPSGPRYSSSVHTGFVYGLDLSNQPTPPLNIFFGLSDPLPVGRVYPVTFLGFVQGIPETLIPLPAMPIFGITFSNPTLRTYYNQRGETVSILASGQLTPLPAPSYFGASGMLVRGT